MPLQRLFAGGPNLLFGRNPHSAALCESFHVDAIIDDFDAGSVFAGAPVIPGCEVDPDSIVINCVLTARGRAARARIDSLNCSASYDYSDLLALFPGKIPLPPFMSDTMRDLERNSSEWHGLETLLCEAESKKTLQDLVEFRKTAKLRALNDYNFDYITQYFDPVVQFSQEEVFVDCGGYDGDTTEQFLKRCPDFRRVYLFEPSAESIAKAKVRLADRPDIRFIQKGVSDLPGRSAFDASNGSASAICEGGPDEIVLTRIDDEITENVTFIKMDLEGWETKAILGAERHITEDHPKLAIAVYHSASDFWTIPRLILSMRDDYDVHLRHYTEGWTDSVMYFIPKA